MDARDKKRGWLSPATPKLPGVRGPKLPGARLAGGAAMPVYQRININKTRPSLGWRQHRSPRSKQGGGGPQRPPASAATRRAFGQATPPGCPPCPPPPRPPGRLHYPHHPGCCTAGSPRGRAGLAGHGRCWAGGRARLPVMQLPPTRVLALGPLRSSRLAPSHAPIVACVGLAEPPGHVAARFTVRSRSQCLWGWGTDRPIRPAWRRLRGPRPPPAAG